MKFLTDPLLQVHEYNEVLDNIRNYTIPVNITGPSDSQKAHIVYSICSHLGCRGLFITFNEMQARKMYEDFSFFLGDDVVFFPTKEIMLHDVEAKSYDAVFQRIEALGRIVDGNWKVIVTSAEAVAQRLVPVEQFKDSVIDVELGGKLDIKEFSQKLVSMGYERVTVVEGKGQFCIRGGIVDVFSVDSEQAVRIELFDDEVDSVRSFDVQSQRSVDKLKRVRILPAREIIYPPEKKEFILKCIENGLREYIAAAEKSGIGHLSQIEMKIRTDMEKLENEYYFPGIDRYIPYIIESPSDISEYAGDAVIFMDEPVRFAQRMENILLEHHEACKSLMEKGQILPKSFEIYYDTDSLNQRLERKRIVNLNTIPVSNQRLKYSKSYSIPSKSVTSYQGHFDLLLEDIEVWKSKKSIIIILSGPRGKGKRLSESFLEKNIDAPYVEELPERLQEGQIIITHGSLNKGFEYPSIGIVVISDREVFGQDRKPKKSKSQKGGIRIKAFTDLEVGDYVVHQTHGIGQYVGMQKLVVDNVVKDYLKIRYQDDGYLYIPTNQMDLIQKYIGTEGKTPRLNKLGGTDWAKTKKRVKESLQELAGELVKLYAERQAVKGFAFSKDTVWQKQFEEMFPYEETEDQLKCIEEIKADMEAPRPMDRLLCGDVGYGKTEVAIRAVFKAVMDGKQVAYLVPTTILAQQHYNTFRERMKEFPITVEVISRFRTPAEQKQIVKGLKAGSIDVLIGTHRLLQKDIQFKNLGLLIVDEEQRFGVTHKEKLKKLKTNVDVLTLTATPIPRTLHMSLIGIRDISIIEDPPEERHPVQTYVMEYNSDVIQDAINRELARGGQVFYLYNRVRSIELKASEIQALVPNARVGIAHGQMNEKQLEDTMFSFLNKEFDVLVCTTIIESGLDMPNVNTIIVEDADKMGLAQLYQIRGRVGRSNRLAYAYITYKKDKVLSEVAEKRLQAIKEFTEFGSGFRIAMRDLEIRGAGNLLGPEQHGHMESVGYDMYCRLLDEAVRELKGEPLQDVDEEISIDINISAYIDDEYISSENQKIDMYKKIASIQDEDDMADIEDELMDRYGDIPEPVNNLIQIAYIKTLARACGFVSIQEKNDLVIFQYKPGVQVDFEVLSALIDKYKRRILFNASSKPYISYRIAGVRKQEVLENIKILLQDIIKLKCKQ